MLKHTAWRKISGDVDGKTYGATYGRIATDKTYDYTSYEIVKIVPLAEYEGDDNDKRVVVTCADYTPKEIADGFTPHVIGTMGIDPTETMSDLHKAALLVDYGYHCDSELEENFHIAMRRHTGHNHDLTF